ncbi:MAG: RagB/SusD family nutrient uptake outer membrane protein [Gemmatimonadales bacterium]
MTNSIRTAGLFGLLLLSPMLLVVQGCSDLTEAPKSSITPDNFFSTEEEMLGGLVAVYAQLRSTLTGYGDYYNVIEVSSDEMIVPTRGQDWKDDGRWLELHRHTWEPNSPSALTDLNGAWVAPFTGVARANVVLEALDKVTLPDAFEAGVRAEARTLRAFYYYLLMDAFGGVPLATDTKVVPRARATRAEVFQFIEQELTEARADLPASWPAADHGRMTQGAADAILASLYLNAAVFTKDEGISITGYNSCQDVMIGALTACEAAVAAADRILNSPAGYMLEPDWRTNFRADNYVSLENILVVKFVNQADLGFRLFHATLHYNQFSPTPWNGFSTLADVYNAFDADDQRLGSFRVGPQTNLDTGLPVNDRQNNPLVFTPTIGDATAATESEGARIGKWPHDPDHNGPDNGNDFAYFRLAEIMLIKAEALNEITPGDANALLLVNQVRERVFEPDEPLATVDRDAILRERLFELVFEAKRRQDQIRFGRFDDSWAFKSASSAHRVLMAIPQTQLDVNPLLCQNAGYAGPVCP